MFESRVRRSIAAAHHNGPEGSRCHTNHGHTWDIVVVFQFPNEIVSGDTYGWGPDFGQIKGIIDEYDHQDLNTRFAGIPPSAENFARILFDQFMVKTGFVPKYVEVEEGGTGNSVRYNGIRE